MELISSLLRTAVLAVIGFFVALGSFFTGHTGAVVALPAATTTQAAFPIATTTVKTSTSTKPAEADVQKPGPTQPVVTAPQAPALSVESLNTLARASLVNILCTTQSGGSFNPISGSGVIVDSRGIILTNAHVGQYFLLRDYPTPDNIDCVVRVGSPAQSRYTAELVYLPPAWIATNAAQIASSTPTGTGENDYSFLLITGTTNPDGTLPASFPALPMVGAEPSTGDQELLAAYPAGFLGGIAITLDLYITSAVATVGQLYSFSDQSNVDMFSLGGTVVSQSGSSGGAVVSMQGKLQGLIATEVTATTTAGRDLRALTVAHINRSLASAGLGGITNFLSQNIPQFATDFNTKLAPAETKALEDVLNQ